MDPIASAIENTALLVDSSPGAKRLETSRLVARDHTGRNWSRKIHERR